MQVQSESIPDEGLAVSADLSETWVHAAVTDAMGGEAQSAEISLLVKKIATCIRVSGSTSATTTTACTRCLAPLEVTVKGESVLFYSPEERGSQPEEIALVKGDMDIGWFDGAALDMGQVLGEQLALWMPERLRCVEGATVQGATVEVRRVEGEGPCEVHAHEGGPDLKRHSPFAGLTLPE